MLTTIEKPNTPVFQRLVSAVKSVKDSQGELIQAFEMQSVIERLLQTVINHPDFEVQIQEILDDLRYRT